MKRTTAQNKRFWALVNAANLDKETVAQMAYQVSEGRTGSTRELDYNEMQWLITLVADIDEQQNGKSRALVCHLLAIWKPQQYQNAQGKLLMDEINKTVQALPVNKSKKSLYHLTGAELNNVVTQVKAIYRKELNR